MFSLDDQSLIAVCHNRFLSILPPFFSAASCCFLPLLFPPKSSTKCRFCVKLIKLDLHLCLRAVFGKHQTEWPSHRKLERTSLSCSVYLQIIERRCAFTHFKRPLSVLRTQRPKSVSIWCLQQACGQPPPSLHEERNEVADTRTTIN